MNNFGLQFLQIRNRQTGIALDKKENGPLEGVIKTEIFIVAVIFWSFIITFWTPLSSGLRQSAHLPIGGHVNKFIDQFLPN